MEIHEVRQTLFEQHLVHAGSILYVPGEHKDALHREPRQGARRIGTKSVKQADQV